MAANDAVSMNVAENRQNVPMAIQENRAAVPMTVAEGGGTPGGLNRKADKVTGAVAGNLAGLDANGNLTDSGKAPGDFLEAPATAGSEGQVLTADGEGGASWQDPTGGDPTEIIDDNAGSGDTDKVWSANKSHELLTAINSAEEDLDNAVFWEETQDDDSVEGIIKSEIIDKMSFSLSGSNLSIVYDGTVVDTVQLPSSQPIPCTGISLDVAVASIEAEKTVTLTATLTPTNTTDIVTWTTSDNTIATVNAGVVTGVAKGTATITVSCGNFSDTCAVTVIAYYKTPVLGYVIAQESRLDYQSRYSWIKGGTFNDPFLRKVLNGQKVKVTASGTIPAGLYLNMYVYTAGTFTDKCEASGDDYVLTQAMLDMQSSSSYGILVSSSKLYSYGQYLLHWAGDYTATQDCYVAFSFNIDGSTDISQNLDAIKNAIRIEVE